MSARPEERHLTSVGHTRNRAEVVIAPTQAFQHQDAPLSREDTILARTTSSCGTTEPRTLPLLFLLACVTLGLFSGLLFMASDHEPIKMINTIRVLPEYISSHRLLIGGCAIALIGCSMGGTFVRRHRISLLRLFEILPSLRAALPRSFLRGGCIKNKVEEVSPVRQETAERVVMQIVAKTLDMPLEHIHRTGDFFEYAIDSHALNRLLFLLEQQLQVKIKADDIFDYSQLSQLAALITQRQQGKS